MSDFTHLHVHSHYSLLDGLGKIRPMIERVKELGMDSMALTDHGAMYGVIEFIRTCQELGVKPIVGVEAYLAPGGHKEKGSKEDSARRHLTLLAQNNNGYQNLLQLTTHAHLEGYYYKPRIDYDLLEKYNEGLIVLSGCLNSDISKAIVSGRSDEAKRLIEWHLNIFGVDRFYLEVQHHPTLKEQEKVNEALIQYGKNYNLGLVATSDSHYIHTEDAEAQDVLICVQTGRTVQEKDRLSMLGEDFSLKSPEELKEQWRDHPEAVDNTQKIAEQCSVELEFGVNRLPHYPLPKGVKADEALRGLCEKALGQKYGARRPSYTKGAEGASLEEARKRLDYELGVIKKTGYASYFLIVQDFVNEAKRRGILVGPGRGSAAGSIVAYLTNVTGLDPLHYNLLFERFLNPERVSMPDIDLDFADDRRDEVIDYVREKYGSKHVAQIITFGTMAARAAVRDAGRALGLPYAFCDQVAKAIPMFMTFEEALKGAPELREMYEQDPQVKRLIDTARKLEGVCRHASTHAAGVVITEEPLTNYVPLQLASASKDDRQIVTQYAMGEVDALGLLKIDFLGLKNLTIIQQALRLIKERTGEEINLENLPLDDRETYRLLQNAQTTGVFQLESAGMKRYLKELVPTDFEDIISMGALYRPGPMDSIPDFIAAKHGRKKVIYLHPLLEPILKKTYGVIVTQEQVLQIAREFAGFTYAEADILRKAVGKKIKKLLDEQREKFIAGAVDNKGIDEKTAERVWGFIEPFARYGFPRAHAAAYAMISYQTAYLKAHYPVDFMAALLTSDEGNTDRQAVEVTEALAMDIKVLPPDVNESDYDYTVLMQKSGKTKKGKGGNQKTAPDSIRMGLGAIKNVGHGVVEAILIERQEGGRFVDLFDLFRRISSKDFNRKAVESLAQAGALDGLEERNLILHNLDRLLEFNRALHRTIDAGQQGLFGESSEQLRPAQIELESVAVASKDDRLNWEKELLGLYLSEHPLGDLREQMEGVCSPLSELASLHSSGATTVWVGGVVTRIKRIVTKKQQSMLFAELEDMVGKAEIVVFPSIYDESGELWEEGAKLLIKGKLNDKDGEVKILADEVRKLSAPALAVVAKDGRGNSSATDLSSAQELSIRLPPSLSREQLQRIRDVLAAQHSDIGDIAVSLLVQRPTGTQIVRTSFRIRRSLATVEMLAQIVGKQSLQYR